MRHHLPYSRRMPSRALCAALAAAGLLFASTAFPASDNDGAPRYRGAAGASSAP